MKSWDGMARVGAALGIVLVLGLGAAWPQGRLGLEPLASGLLQYRDPVRRISFQMPAGFAEDLRPHPVEEPPYDLAFSSANHKIQVRVRVEDLTGAAGTVPVNLATQQHVTVSATTYAMNRYRHRSPKDVFLCHMPPPPGCSALCIVVGALPPASRYQAEKTIFVGVPPNRMYTVATLFQEGDLSGALQVAETIVPSLDLRLSATAIP